MPRGTLDPEEVVATRRRLCQAALGLYSAEGVEAVTFRRLAKQLGTSHTQPYRYFDSKEDLFAMLRRECFERFFERIRSTDKPQTTPAHRLEAIYLGILDYVQSRPAEYLVMFSTRQPDLAAYPGLLAARRAAFDYLVGIVQIAVDQGEIAGDARGIMHIAWGAVHGLLTLHTAGQLVHGRDVTQLTWPLLHTVFYPLFARGETESGDCRTGNGRPA